MGNLILRGCKTIAEYAFRRWMADNGFVDRYFTLEISGNDAIIRDKVGNTLNLTYDKVEKCVKAEEQGVILVEENSISAGT